MLTFTSSILSEETIMSWKSFKSFCGHFLRVVAIFHHVNFLGYSQKVSSVNSVKQPLILTNLCLYFPKMACPLDVEQTIKKEYCFYAVSGSEVLCKNGVQVFGRCVQV